MTNLKKSPENKTQKNGIKGEDLAYFWVVVGVLSLAVATVNGTVAAESKTASINSTIGWVFFYIGIVSFVVATWFGMTRGSE